MAELLQWVRMVAVALGLVFVAGVLAAEDASIRLVWAFWHA